MKQGGKGEENEPKWEAYFVAGLDYGWEMFLYPDGFQEEWNKTESLKSPGNSGPKKSEEQMSCGGKENNPREDSQNA